ncbi:hypothetical protein Back11_42310 [Paenibacillus baekrokdamisoli]|uniref:Uncharacterized protein n=1 Tax=Paenibacillus baekrokdamisoli TaxID=1712516 RepID=A0A3G9IWJ4_9BACL|nr:hypothetical protein [Paenibacillus baekrokdamisoli]MBB3068070.1 hypothetical protein [Paenibacillus baekrokdamisoli]BBH22886.1 hypothetical protein Back11_42310 [Paenibacillus baekrokdamisoli]
MRIGSIALIGLTFLLLVACGSKSQTPLSFVDTVASTDLSQEKGGAVSLGITEKSLVEQLGKPQRTLNEGNMDFLIMYDDYQYTSRDNTIIGYSLSPKVRTAKEVKVGDSLADVTTKYGDAYYTREQDRSSFRGYIDKKNKWVLEFVIKDDQVTAINMSQLSSYE